ncbi:MAG: DUF3299 domain-containing protein [Gammaproteobacteria bacterium]|nr:DUF3299 domain-containing protein [Gammaproteobacteria bacterium]MBU1443792.1 DUF3299 domain-containing protein [Gammaproteobacteria bacterium]MBU2286550.1 DUF3299 domain-containing protein [Gammaproteobacteria bacterium]MBU2410367.1 DUF3299 domain-containing protein [Gammaproteobacteria bacterium]
MHIPSTSTPFSRRRLLQALAASASLSATPWLRAAEFSEIAWEELVPPGWDPSKSFADLQKLGELPDSDPRVKALYDRMRKVWDEAPTVASLDGRKVKLPGFVVPLEKSEKGLKEFLLVPYFGACIHTPPPPANQIIHVHANPPARGFETMSPVWVSGTLRLERKKSEMGASGYRLDAAQVDKYRAK